jgi:hypothetical protein
MLLLNKEIMNTQFLLLIIILCVIFLMMNNNDTTINSVNKNNIKNNNNKNNNKNNNNNNNKNTGKNSNIDSNNDQMNTPLENINSNNNNQVNAASNTDTENVETSNENTVSHIELEMTSNNSNDKNKLLVANVEAFQNTISNKSLTLFYSKTCPHSLTFLKVWHKLLDEKVFADGVELLSVECGAKPEQCQNNNITSVPILVIQNQSKKHIMNGNQSIDSVLEQCKLMGMYVKDPIEEGFASSAYYISGDVAAKFIEKSTDEDCPFVSFSQYEDYNRNKNYCASGEHGNGCVKGITGSKVQDLTAAYSQVGSYLVSLPDSSQDKMNKCAAQKAESIRKFNLCGQNVRLKQIADYGKDIENQISKPLFLNTDFEDNVKISNAIRHACSQT